MTNTVLLNKTDKTARKTGTTPHLSVPACDHACTNKWGVFCTEGNARQRAKQIHAASPFPPAHRESSTGIPPQTPRNTTFPPSHPQNLRYSPTSPAGAGQSVDDTIRGATPSNLPRRRRAKRFWALPASKATRPRKGSGQNERACCHAQTAGPFGSLNDRRVKNCQTGRFAHRRPGRCAHAPIWFTARRRR